MRFDKRSIDCNLHFKDITMSQSAAVLIPTIQFNKGSLAYNMNKIFCCT